MFSPKAVIFDFFGTLVPNFTLSEHKAVLGEMGDTVGALRDEFVQQWLDTVVLRMTGEFASVQANIEAICDTLSVPFDAEKGNRAAELRYTYERAHIAPRPTAIATLREIRARGLKIGLITDCSIELPELWRETEFAPLFDVTIFSAVAKMKKPNPKIYHMAASELGVECVDCLYVGDGGSNELAGAMAVGMRPIWLCDEAEQGTDAHRIGHQPWAGEKFGDLSEMLAFIPKTKK